MASVTMAIVTEPPVEIGRAIAGHPPRVHDERAPRVLPDAAMPRRQRPAQCIGRARMEEHPVRHFFAAGPVTRSQAPIGQAGEGLAHACAVVAIFCISSPRAS